MKQLFEKHRKASKIFISNQTHIHGGINRGNYPKHCFKLNIKNIKMPLNIISVGSDYWKSGCFRYRKNSHMFAIELVTSGKFAFEQNNKIYEVAQGDLFIVHKNADNAMFSLTPDAQKYAIIIDGDFLTPTLLELGLINVDFIPQVPPKVYETFKKIENLLAHCGDDYMLDISCEIFRIFNILSREKHMDYPEKLHEIIDYIHSNLEKPLSLEHLTTHFKVSSSTLSRLFKENLGETVFNFILTCKMTSASRLLSFSEQSIKEISASLGYANQLYFSTSFHKFFGVSPKEHRLKGNIKK